MHAHPQKARRGAVLVALILAGMAAAPRAAWGQWTTGSGGTIYYNGGNVGIGTTSPSGLLQLSTSSLQPTILFSGTRYYDGGTSGTPGVALLHYFDGPLNKQIVFADATQLSSTTIPGIRFNVGPTTALIDAVTPNGANFKNLSLAPFGGNVGIGTVNPQHLLHVAGTIGAEKVLVTSTGADYVFAPGYRLKPLSEVARYIQANHHLPDIPSAEEVKRKGMGVGEMEAKLLAKVEELTLHMIQQEKENQELRDRIARLEKGAVTGAAPADAK